MLDYITVEPTHEAADALVEPRDRPVGSTATAKELKDRFTDDATGYSIAPSLAAIDYTFALFADKFIAQGFNSPSEIGAVLAGAVPVPDLWAVKVDQPVADDTLFVRIA